MKGSIEFASTVHDRVPELTEKTAAELMVGRASEIAQIIAGATSYETSELPCLITALELIARNLREQNPIAGATANYLKAISASTMITMSVKPNKEEDAHEH